MIYCSIMDVQENLTTGVVDTEDGVIDDQVNFWGLLMIYRIYKAREWRQKR